MSSSDRCNSARFELSVAHDEARQMSAEATQHLTSCAGCTTYLENLGVLDEQLARGDFDRAPDLAPTILATLTRARPVNWWQSAVAVAAVGLLVGSLVGVGGTRIDRVVAQDLNERFHEVSPTVEGVEADLVVVERGWHPDVPERVYTGSLAYNAPESLAITLDDTTSYPGPEWIPNDVTLEMADGNLTTTAMSRCPVAAMPGCLGPALTTALRDQRPFDEGAIVPLEVLGTGSGFASWSGLEVVGLPDLEGRATIQIETTVAAVDLIRAITNRGAWREFHPTDQVLMWLDMQTLLPLRVEIFSAQSTERDLWQVRRGYRDEPGGEPIFIVQMDLESLDRTDVDLEIPENALSGGFVDGPANTPRPRLEPGFVPHRSGTWSLPDGGVVDVATWSDGRAWIMVEVTRDWSESHLFGMSLPFVFEVELGDGSIGYLDPRGGAVAIHGDSADVVITGSLAEDSLLNAATSLEIVGRSVPGEWVEASVVEVGGLPPATLIPEGDGWSMLGLAADDRVTILMTGSGDRTVLIDQVSGDRLDAPKGADFVAVELRGLMGRINSGTATLEWVEDGRIIQMRSETVATSELVEIAESMKLR